MGPLGVSGVLASPWLVLEPPADGLDWVGGRLGRAAAAGQQGQRQRRSQQQAESLLHFFIFIF